MPSLMQWKKIWPPRLNWDLTDLISLVPQERLVMNYSPSFDEVLRNCFPYALMHANLHTQHLIQLKPKAVAKQREQTI